MDLTKLKEPFPTAKISWRVGATNVNRQTEKLNWGDKPVGIPLAYIDARDVMERLDEVCGPENWDNDYPFKGCCRIGINTNRGMGDKANWVWKSNGAGETDVEADKGQYSDAFKRAAVLWGIGRYLYDVPNIWVEIEKKGRSWVIKDLNDPKLTAALNDAVNAAPPIDMTMGEDDVPPESWLKERIDNLSEFAIAPKASLDGLDVRDQKARNDPIYGKLNDEQKLLWYDAVKETEYKIKQKEKEAA